METESEANLVQLDRDLSVSLDGESIHIADVGSHVSPLPTEIRFQIESPDTVTVWLGKAASPSLSVGPPYRPPKL